MCQTPLSSTSSHVGRQRTLQECSSADHQQMRLNSRPGGSHRSVASRRRVLKLQAMPPARAQAPADRLPCLTAAHLAAGDHRSVMTLFTHFNAAVVAGQAHLMQMHAAAVVQEVRLHSQAGWGLAGRPCEPPLPSNSLRNRITAPGPALPPALTPAGSALLRLPRQQWQQWQPALTAESGPRRAPPSIVFALQAEMEVLCPLLTTMAVGGSSPLVAHSLQEHAQAGAAIEAPC